MPKEFATETSNLRTFCVIQILTFLSFVTLEVPSNLYLVSQMFLTSALGTIELLSLYLEIQAMEPPLMCGHVDVLLQN